MTTEREDRAWNLYLNEVGEGEERLKWEEMSDTSKEYYLRLFDEGYYKYQHVERIGRSQTQGLLDGEVYVFPKIDGTNAHVWKDDAGVTHYGSRNRELSLNKDNAGFMAWASEDNALMELMRRVGNGYHVFGEWLVPHSLKTYSEDAWRQFYIFDVVQIETGSHVPYDEYKAICDSVGYTNVIEPLAILKNPSPADIVALLDANKFLIEGDGCGEGVVCKNYDYRNKYGRQTWGKIVTAEFKENAGQRLDKDKPHRPTDCVENQIVDKFLTKAMIDKVVAKIGLQMDENGEEDCWTGKMIPRLLGMVWFDFVVEEIFDALKKFKNPTIDFRYLNSLVIAKVKAEREDLF